MDRHWMGPLLLVQLNDLHVLKRIWHLSTAIEAGHVCVSEIVLARPRCAGMHTIEQISKYPFQ